VTTLTNWHYFRSDGADVNVKRIHSDIQSRISVLARVRRMVLMAGLPTLASLGYFPIMIFSGLAGPAKPFLIGVYILLLAVVILVAYSLFRVNREIKRLSLLGKE
jgi:high-affinity Fe2+/Pb2+ permease